MATTTKKRTVTEKRMYGVWTPWAEVLCFKCHGPKDKRTGEDVSAYFKANLRGSHDGPGFCTRCGEKIWVDETVAHLTRLRKVLGGDMNQTGGMCSALSIANAADTHYAVVTTESGDDVFIGYYTKEAWDHTGDEAIVCYTIPFTSLEVECAAIQAVLTGAAEVPGAKKVMENGVWL